MLISEALYLLLTDREGKPEAVGMDNLGMTAAVIIDLVVAERVVLSDEKSPRVYLISQEPTGHPVLDTAQSVIAQRHGYRLEALISWPRLDPRAAVVTSLIHRGVLALDDRPRHGFGPQKTPEINPEPEQMIRMRIAAVLAGQAPADIAESTLLSILHGMGLAHKILRQEAGGMSAHGLKKRIAEVSEHSAAGSAVEKSVQAMQTLMTGAMVALMAGGAS